MSDATASYEALAYGISDDPRRFWDIEHARRVLGFEPQDAAPALFGDED